MCNAYTVRTPAHRFYEDLAQLGLPLVSPERARIPNLQPRDITRPTNTLPVFRPVDAGNPGAGLEMIDLRWWLVPFFHKGPDVKAWKAMCTNAKAETVRTSATFREPYRRRRCLVPADGFYEWTGPAGAKTRHLFTPSDGNWFAFAGLWDRWKSAEGPIDSFTIITTTPGPDAAPFHSRQPVILRQREFARWLDLSADPHDLLVSSPAGDLCVDPPEPAAAA